MKKISYIFLLCLCALLCSCNSDRKESRESEQNEEKNRQEEQVEDRAEAEAQTGAQDEDEGEYPVVLDERGGNIPLKLGEVDVEDVGYELPPLSFASDYSQVLDGHYYYLRTDGDGNYTVYRDKGEKVVCFAIGTHCYVGNFVKYGKRFYAFIMKDGRKGHSDLADTLVSIDAGTGKLAVVKDMTGVLDEDDELEGAVIYRDIFYYENDVVEEEESSYVGPRGLAWFSLKGASKENFPATPSGVETMHSISAPTFIDGKIYYTSQDKREVTLFSYDLESGREKEIFSYKTSYLSWGELKIEMDQDYIYSQDHFMIPREGGQMVSISEDGDADIRAYSPDGRYTFYLDRSDRIHRIDKKNHRDDVISVEIPLIDGIDCTADGIYIREYNEAEDEYKEKEYCDPRSNNLYYMDYDGKNCELFWDKVVEED